MTREFESSWRDLKAAGVDPVFMHHVTPGREASIDYPHAADVLRTPSQFKARVGDVTPYVRDPAVVLTHQGLELMSRRATEDFVGSVTDMYGRTVDDLRARFLPAARRRALRDPRIDVEGHLERLIGREFTEWDPASIIPWRAPRSTARAAATSTRVYLPNTVATVIKQLHTPSRPFTLTAALDPITNLFRTSVLALSPRFLLNNIVSGAVMVGARTSPGVFRYLRAAREAINDGTLPSELRFQLGESTRDLAEFNIRAGGTLRRLFDEAQQSTNPTVARAGAVASPRCEAGAGFVEGSYRLNALVDDTYRTMGYLHTRDRALTKGMTAEQAERAGLDAARKVLQTWDDMTPVERSILRRVMPWYSFAKLILGYVAKYPIDHPVRAAVTASIARAELDDLGTGLPETFLNVFFLGEPDDNGHVTALTPGGMNPFRDVANYFTLAGFLGSTNPLLSTILETAGIDTGTGGPELYPNLRYSPETGRLTVDNPNPLLTLVSNVIPQTRILTALTGTSAEYRELLATNPAAARRLLALIRGPAFAVARLRPATRTLPRRTRQGRRGTPSRGRRAPHRRRHRRDAMAGVATMARAGPPVTDDRRARPLLADNRHRAAASARELPDLGSRRGRGRSLPRALRRRRLDLCWQREDVHQELPKELQDLLRLLVIHVFQAVVVRMRSTVPDDPQVVGQILQL